MALGDIISIVNTSASDPKLFYGNRLVPGGRKLIVSNNPEEIGEAGILYRDTMQGAWRVCVHHQNRWANKRPAQILVAIENFSDSTVDVVVERRGEMTCSDPQFAGYQALLQFLTPQSESRLTLQPKQHFFLGNRYVRYLETFSALYDFLSPVPVVVHIISLDEYSHPDLAKMPILQQNYLPDGSFTIRGTFPYSEVSGTFVYYVGSPWRGAEFGNNPYGSYKQDPWWDWNWSQVYPGEYPAGRNVLDQAIVYNWGNYGVFYNLELIIKHVMAGTDVTGIYLNPRGGSYFGPVMMGQQTIIPSRPVEPLREAMELELGMTLSGMTCPVPIRFMPPGGSSLPVRIIAGREESLHV